MSVDDLANTLSVEEAAATLGVSGQTVRRMIKRGQVRGELVIGPKGKEWRVRLGDATRLPVVHESNSVEESPGLLELVHVVQQMHNNFQQVATENADLRTVNALLKAENAALREHAEELRRQQVLPPPRPWWQFWR